MADKITSNKKKVDEENIFKRTPELEPFFVAIMAGPVVKTIIDKDIMKYDDHYYLPEAITYYSDRGFYPFCFDSIHNKLVVLVNKDFKFPLEDWSKSSRSYF